MFRTVEAVVDEQGAVHLLEAIELPRKKYRAFVTILEESPQVPINLRPYGLCVGQFTVPDNFNDPLPEEILREFEGG
jgi:hypothetical protein